MIDLFSRGVLNLYRGIQSEPLDSFQAWALNQIKTLLSFDSAAWGTGVIAGDGVIVHALYLHDLPTISAHLNMRLTQITPIKAHEYAL